MSHEQLILTVNTTYDMYVFRPLDVHCVESLCTVVCTVMACLCMCVCACAALFVLYICVCCDIVYSGYLETSAPCIAVRAGLPNVHSVHVHSRPHHKGGPTTVANVKNCY